MNITLSVDAQLVERARQVAKQQGISLNEMVRNYLQTVAGEVNGDDVVRELELLWESHAGHSGGKRFDRSDAYEGRL
ncbi:hypothetical protein FRD01_13165 [Microvenator marinus]|uniref:Uncharacterized protein n=1 Tax=Microvenator marinus TaxID=2600177 RepID=A0A5B8XVP9_9DELT|nr:DUF6364 family protein [Microvenator marinus]QED28163.1 hypothetical protein FRD01_13165 [Microvenator marinus]